MVFKPISPSQTNACCLLYTSLPAFVAYPTYSVGAIVVISLFSFLLFREKLSKLQLAGVGIILSLIHI